MREDEKSERESAAVVEFIEVGAGVGPGKQESTQGQTAVSIFNTHSVMCRMPSSICTPVLFLRILVTPAHSCKSDRLRTSHTYTINAFTYSDKHRTEACTHIQIQC